MIACTFFRRLPHLSILEDFLFRNDILFPSFSFPLLYYLFYSVIFKCIGVVFFQTKATAPEPHWLNWPFSILTFGRAEQKSCCADVRFHFWSRVVHHDVDRLRNWARASALLGGWSEKSYIDWTGPDRNGPDRTGPDQTGPAGTDQTRQPDHTGPDQTVGYILIHQEVQ